MSSSDPFQGIPAPLRAALEKRGFAQLTQVQTAIVAALGETENANRNLRISSQTGSGKTVALGIALAPALLEPSADGRGPRALIITPTRELAVQVQSELAWLFEEAPGVRVDAVTGGTDVRREKRRLAERAEILVGTPGRLLDHIKSRALRCDAIREVVLDEADQMLDMGFKDELDAIVSHLPAERRSHLVSATFPPAVRALAENFQDGALHVQGTSLGQANQDIAHIAYLVRPRQQYAAIVNLLLEDPGDRCLIFVRTRLDTAELCESLTSDGFGALPFSGDLPQAQRTRTLDAFRSGTIRVLVATDVAARGIDVPDIATVIHADIPKGGDVYTHRSGRTGRAGKTGKSLIIVPVNAQARVHRMFRDARVEVTWEAVPSPKKIRLGVTKATRRAFYEQLAAASFTEAELTYAQNLLEKQPPAQVVAMLLRMAERPLPREPMEVQPAEPRAFEPQSPRGARAGAPPASYVRFAMTWGEQQGATVARCMSHVCRRGGVTRHDIGIIEVGSESTTVEINAGLAAEFERRCAKPDPRDPHVAIVRQGEGAEPRRARPVVQREQREYRPEAPRTHRPPPADRLGPPRGPRVKRAARGTRLRGASASES